MSARVAAWLAWALWALCVTLAALAVLLDVYSPQVRSHPKFVVLAGLPLLVYPTIGAIVVSRRPKNAVGWILCGMGLIFEVLAFAGAYASYAMRFAHRGSLPGGKIMGSLDPWSVAPSLLLGTVLLVLLFPDGKLPTAVELDPVPVNRMWRTVVAMAVCGASLVTLWWVTWPGGAVEVLGRIGGGILVVSFVASVFSVFARLQRAEGRERQQLKWFAYGAAVFMGGFFLLQGAGEQTSEWAIFVVIVAGLMVIPVTVGIAIMRYRLNDIDLLINRTLVYGALTVLLVLVYVGGVVGLQSAFRALTGEESTLAVVASTLAIAALFGPLRRRVQALVDRRFYRRKYDAARTLAAFNARLRDETDLDTLRADVVGVANATVQPEHSSLWLRPDASRKAERAG